MPKHVRRWYKNLTRLNQGHSLDESLEIIRADELNAFKHAMDSEEGKNHDLKRRYVYDQHRVAIIFLRACGWKTPRCNNYISSITLEHNLKTCSGALLKELDVTYYYFESQRVFRIDIKQLDTDKCVATWISLIKRVLYIMYGCNIKYKRSLGMYKMTPCELFSYDPQNTTKPIVYTQCI